MLFVYYNDIDGLLVALGLPAYHSSEWIFFIDSSKRSELLVDRKNIILPQLYIKLGSMKQFIKALDREGYCFHYICSTFPRVSDEKKKAGIFDGPQIRTLLKDKHFMARMTAVEARAWGAFTNVVQVLLGTRKTTTT